MLFRYRCGIGDSAGGGLLGDVFFIKRGAAIPRNQRVFKLFFKPRSIFHINFHINRASKSLFLKVNTLLFSTVGFSKNKITR